MRILISACALAWSMAVPLAAQSIAQRVAAASDGAVRLSFAARPGVCGDGLTFIREGERSIHFSSADKVRDRDCVCEPGPVRVSLSVSGRRVTKLRTFVGGSWQSAKAVTDLGTVGTAQAVQYLLDLAADPTSSAAEEAIFPATLADSVTVWPKLIALARNDAVQSDSRKQAVFWLSQAAGEAATADLAELAEDNDEDREVREHAVFALSQLPDDQGVPALLRIARTNRDPEVRKKALFWLGQSEDPRALSLFEELLVTK